MAINAIAIVVLLLLGTRALLCVSGTISHSLSFILIYYCLCVSTYDSVLFLVWWAAERSSRNYPFVKEANQNAVWESHYDYIIVGGGTAGCPLAATLSQNATVLLLERGGSPYDNSNKFRIENFFGNLLDIVSPQSPTQAFVSEDGVLNQRARVLGGGTCLNAGFYSRASPQEIEAMGLEPKLVSDSYHWVENVVAHEPPQNEWQKAVAQGLVECGVTPFNGFTYDHIPGTKIGGTIFNQTGDRSTAADILSLANTKTLTVLLYASVERVLFTKEGTHLSNIIEHSEDITNFHSIYLAYFKFLFWVLENLLHYI